jgi:hypothetical protein
MSILLLGLMTLPAASGTSSATISSPWCFDGPQPAVSSPAEARHDVLVTPVRPERMLQAVRALAERSVIELRGREADRWLPLDAARVGKRYYLVRSAIYLPAGARIEATTYPDDEMRLDVNLIERENSIVLVTLQSVRTPGSRVGNMAVVVQADFQIDRVYVACYATH